MTRGARAPPSQPDRSAPSGWVRAAPSARPAARSPGTRPAGGRAGRAGDARGSSPLGPGPLLLTRARGRLATGLHRASERSARSPSCASRPQVEAARRHGPCSGIGGQLLAQWLRSLHHLPRPALHPRVCLRGPGVDPGRLVTGALAPDPGLGNVRVCVLLRDHHCPARPVLNWRPWRGGFLGHLGCSLPLHRRPVLPQCLRPGSSGHHPDARGLQIQAVPREHLRRGVLVHSHPAVRDPRHLLFNPMEVFIKPRKIFS